MASERLLRLTLPCAQIAQADLRHALEYSTSAQVKAAAVHIETLTSLVVIEMSSLKLRMRRASLPRKHKSRLPCPQSQIER